jgi:hypothetical protein
MKRLLYQLSIADSTYNTEYDGKMYTQCVFCGYSDERPFHDGDCLVVQAQSILEVEWREIHNEVEEENKRYQQEIESLASRAEYYASKTKDRSGYKPCPSCGRRVGNIKQHRKNSNRCKSSRGES